MNSNRTCIYIRTNSLASQKRVNKTNEKHFYPTISILYRLLLENKVVSSENKAISLENKVISLENKLASRVPHGIPVQNIALPLRTREGVFFTQGFKMFLLLVH